MKVTQQTIKVNNKAVKEEPVKVVPTLFKSLINNRACIVAGTKFPWWIAVIVYFLAVGVSFVPSVTTTGTTKGSYVLKNTYSLDTGMEEFSNILNGITYQDGSYTDPDATKSINLVVKKNADGVNELVFDDTASETNWKTYCTDAGTTMDVLETTAADTTENVKHYYYQFNKNTGSVDEDGNVIVAPRLRVFIELGEEGYDGLTPAYRTFFKNPIFGINSSLGVDEETYQAPCSILVLGSHNFYLAPYKTSATKNSEYSNTPYKGDYTKMNTADGGIYLKNLLQSEDENIEGNVSLLDSKWVSFFNAGYGATNKANTLYMFLLVGGMNAAIIVIFGFTLWLMTRGKKNPNNTMKLYQAMRIAIYLSLAPAIITLAVGFLFSNLASFMFVLIMSLRLMWTSMKELRPIA